MTKPIAGGEIKTTAVAATTNAQSHKETQQATRVNWRTRTKATTIDTQCAIAANSTSPVNRSAVIANTNSIQTNPKRINFQKTHKKCSRPTKHYKSRLLNYGAGL